MKYEIVLIYDLYGQQEQREKFFYTNKDIYKILNDFTFPDSACKIIINKKNSINDLYDIKVSSYIIEMRRKQGVIYNKDKGIDFTNYIMINDNRKIKSFFFHTWDNEKKRYIYRRMRREEKEVSFLD